MGLVYLLPLAFTACAPNSKWCHLAYAFTTSGGPVGFFFLLVFTGICYTLSEEGIKQKVVVFLKTVLSLVLVMGVLAYVNERLTKPILKSQRPSHLFMLGQTSQSQAIDSLYQLSKAERKVFFAQLIKNNPAPFNQIDPTILEHWVEESGYSFPSGHTFNAFLFSMIIAYAIFYNRSKPQWRKLYFIPFLWALGVAVSRVAVGAHSALDVSAGAALGVLLGTILLYFDFTRHWLTRKH
ncbi:MAG: phosphatase PAP2 family protein [Bacteroidia bacterium]|nr:phosphatase PAP2 family protein [Bacteroidia bacterium]